MSKTHQIFILFVLGILVASCATPRVSQPTLVPTNQPIPSIPAQPTSAVLPEVRIVRHPQPADLSSSYEKLTSIPKFDPDSTDVWQIDLRSRDLTEIDLRFSLTDLMFANFDSKTQWPTRDQMPTDFDWRKIMELNKDPGLGVRALHEQGITGKGVGIAIIDYPLLVDHIEYKDRIRLYEEMKDLNWTEAQMHGSATTSIAAGKTVGVAPDADIYFIAEGTCGATSMVDLDFSCDARAIRRVVAVNQSLPVDRKIRALSVFTGGDPRAKGYAEVTTAINEAKSAGIFVISDSVGHFYGFYFQGLGRDPLSDPNQFSSYEPGLWWKKDFFSGEPLSSFRWYPPGSMLLIPMDSRTTASPTGMNDYVFYRQGGWSWSVPYLAGMYALSVQVKPDITPEQFWNTALQTGKTIQLQHDGKEYQFGVILDPQALIKALKNK